MGYLDLDYFPGFLRYGLHPGALVLGRGVGMLAAVFLLGRGVKHLIRVA